MEFAKVHGIDELMEACYTFMAREFEILIGHSSFTSLSVSEVSELLGRDDLITANGEESVFRAICTWMSERGNKRTTRLLPSLIKQLRPCNLPENCIESFADQYPIIETDAAFR